MQAGKMKYRLEKYEPKQVSTGYGTAVPSEPEYESRGTCRAERVVMRAKAVIEGGEMFADYSVEWNVRDAHKIAEGWRVRQLGGDLYEVTGVTPNLDRGYVTITTSRVNE